MSLHTGDTLGPYEITGVLGKGGMGEVFRARDPRLKRDVAIKVAGTAFSERFQREAVGKWLLVTREDEATQIDVLLLALTEGVPADQRLRPLLNGPTHQGQATVSPDGRTVAYTSLEAGRVQVYIRSFPDGGDQRKVREETSAEPRWGADGRELFFRANDASNTMWSVDVSRTGTLGTPRSLFRAPVMGAGGFNNSPNYEVSRDGRRILAVVNAEAARDAPLTVIVNWKAARP